MSAVAAPAAGSAVADRAVIADLHFPTQVVFGRGALDRIGPLARGWSERALVVTDRGMVASGLVDEVTSRLRASGVTATRFDAVEPNPTIDHVEAGLDAGADREIGLIVSVGGGSAHDCAKAIALVAANGGSARDYEGVDRSRHRAVPLIAVNTTAGSGADVSRYAVINDPERAVKMIIADRHLTPRVAVNDPLMTIGLPVGQTTATGLDALSHAIEAAVSTAASPVSDLLALRALDLAVEHLPRVVTDGRDIDARESMMLAALLAGLAINSALVGAVHALSHAAGAAYDLPHGVLNGLLLPAVVEWNLPAARGRYAEIAARFAGRPGRTGAAPAERLPDLLRAFGARVGLPHGLAALGIRREDLPDLVDRAMADLCMTTNPRPMARDDVVAAYERAL